MTEPRGKGDAVSPENDGRSTRSLASQQSGPRHFSSSDAAGQVIRARHAPSHRTTPAGGSGASRGMRLAGSADPGREDFGSRRGLSGGTLNHEVSGTPAISRQSHATAKRRRYREGHRVSQTRVASLLRLVGVLTIIVSMFAYATPAFAGGSTVPGQKISRFQDSGSDGGSGKALLEITHEQACYLVHRVLVEPLLVQIGVSIVTRSGDDVHPGVARK